MKPTPHYLILLVLLGATAAAAQPAGPAPVALTINGRAFDADEAALLQDGSLLVSGEALVSELGLNLSAEENGLWRLRGYERQLLLRPDSRAYRLDGQELQAPTSPVLRGSDLFIPAQILLQPFGLTVGHATGWELTSLAAAVSGVRQGTHEDRVRFVVDLSSPALFRWYEEPGKLVLEFPSPPDAVGRTRVLRLHQFQDELAGQVTESLEDGVARLVFSHASTEPPQLFTLSDPARIVIDLLRAAKPAPATPLTPPADLPRPLPGDIWNTHVFSGAKGPVQGFVIRFDPSNTGWRLRPALAGETIMQRSRVSRIASRSKAYGALNGGYFSTLGPPLGMLVIDGEWIKAPLYNRAVLGISTDGRYAIAQTELDAQVQFEGLGCLPLEGLNEGHVTPDSVVAYNRYWGPVVCGAPGRTRVVVGSDGVVTFVLTSGEDACVPEGGFVLSGAGLRAESLRRVTPGQKVNLAMRTNPNWEGLQHAVGGGPMLIVDGKIAVNGSAERFRTDITVGSRPRSAVGLTAGGEVILLAVQKPGLTLRELATVLLKLGAYKAMNLDGGGSTTMVVDGKVLNAPGDGCERAVSNALLVVKG